MGTLFDLPETRGNKGADSKIVRKSTTKKSAPLTVKGGGLFEKIAGIKSLVDGKLGKYKD